MKINQIRWIALAALGAFLACTTVASAQTATNSASEQAPGKKRGGLSIERLTTELKLTDEQKPKVEALLKDFGAKQRELRNDTSLSQEEQRTKRQALNEDRNKKLKEILTPEQFESFQKLFQGRKQAKKAADTKTP